MLTHEQSELLTRTGPGTPGGALLRRYWQPVALIEELPPGGAPLSLRVLGEDLVLFRNQAGQAGLLALHCPHRGTDLSYGRIEDGGLRCIYHGWLFDVAGRCLEQPGEPPGSDFKDRVRQPAYPCREAAGLIFAYLGPGSPPELPAYEILTAPGDHVGAFKILHECNYLQANEGNIDPGHLSFLHRMQTDREQYQVLGAVTAPRLEVEETDFGLRIFAVREAGPDRVLLRVSNFIYPNLSAFPGETGADGYSINWHVPADDTHHWKYMIRFRRSAPLDRDGLRTRNVTGHLTPDWLPLRNRHNRYLQDRSSMDRYFAGLGPSFADHDLCATEMEGDLQDRTTEHLAYTDKAVAAARRLLVRAIERVRRGDEAPHVVRDPAANRFPHLVVLAEMAPADWRSHVAARLESAAAGADRVAQPLGGPEMA